MLLKMINENWYPALLAYLRNFEQEMPAEFDSLLFSRLSEPVCYDKDTLGNSKWGFLIL